MSGRNHPTLTQPTYRRDIDGLRAVAIIAVLFFHAFPDSLPGGFIGVDIFFVISGYLISSILLSSMERERFDLVEFYVRRVRRIFPALLAVVTVVLVFGWMVLFASEFKILGKHIAASAGFVQNLVLWQESGYFDRAGEVKPLLHLWSLAVEEQFYIFWPVLVAYTWRRHRSFLSLTAVIGFLSFGSNIYLTQIHTSAAFYLPVSRFWELMLGGLLAYTALHRPELLHRHYQLRSSLGVGMLVAGLVFVDRSAFPGWWALLPTLGSFLIIAAGPDAWANRLVLASRPMVWVGLISYPLYLWHWPLLSFARIIHGGVPTVAARIAALILAVMLAWLTYRLIEKPIRFGRKGRGAIVWMLLLMLSLGSVGVAIWQTNGTAAKSGGPYRTAFDGGDLGHSVDGCGISDVYRGLFPICLHDGRGAAKYALLGDSKANALYPGLVRTSTEQGRWLFIGGAGRDSPTPLLSSDPALAYFQQRTTVAINSLVNNSSVETVVIVFAARTLFQISDGTTSGGVRSYDFRYALKLNETPSYQRTFDGLDRAVSSLVDGGKKVVLVVDNPTLPDPADCLTRHIPIPGLDALLVNPNLHACRLSLTEHRTRIHTYLRLLNSVRDRHRQQVRIFDPTELLCNKDAGVCGPLENGRMLYAFTDHISDYAAGRIGAQLNSYLRIPRL